MKKKEKLKKAVALGYNEKVDSAPKVLAKGKGFLAEKMIEIARESGVEIYEDADLVEVLSAVEIDSEIPKELYRAVAEVLAFIYTINSKKIR